MYGGVAPNPLNSLAHVLAGLKDRDGRITIPTFYDDVRDPSPEELREWEALPFDEDALRSEIGARELEGEPGYSLRERLWSRPTLDVHGVVGGFQDEGTKTVIPARALAKASMRLAPDQDPERILRALEASVQELATPGVEVVVKPLGYARGAVFGVHHPGVEAARAAFRAAFGAEPALKRMGATVPVAADFQHVLDPFMVVTGFGLPTDGLHSPNERFALGHYHAATEMILTLMAELESAPLKAAA
jgi:acetylornithine deacetylase/succinyl-diaminopimelate desuccinylase-like protein